MMLKKFTVVAKIRSVCSMGVPKNPRILLDLIFVLQTVRHTKSPLQYRFSLNFIGNSSVSMHLILSQPPPAWIYKQKSPCCHLHTVSSSSFYVVLFLSYCTYHLHREKITFIFLNFNVNIMAFIAHVFAFHKCKTRYLSSRMMFKVCMNRIFFVIFFWVRFARFQETVNKNAQQVVKGSLELQKTFKLTPAGLNA